MSLTILPKLILDKFLSLFRISYIGYTLSLITLQAIFRKRGCYYHRYFLEAFIIFYSGFCGFIASIFLPWFGLESYINCVPGKICYYSTKYLLGISVELEGEENYNPENPSVLVMNHQTLVDIAIFGALVHKGCIIAPKKSLQRIPIFGWYLTRSQSIIIDRESQSKTIASMKKASIELRMKKTTPYIFPEGTRRNHKDNDFLPFKKGAFHLAKQADVPILPVVVGNYHHIISTKEKYVKSGTIKVKILPPVPIKDFEDTREGINQATEHVRNLMLKEYMFINAALKSKKV